MKSRPILFSAPMIRAILSGAKTQTRRIFWQAAGPSLDIDVDEQLGVAVLSWLHGPGPGHKVQERTARHACPYGLPGDRLWVRETWARIGWDGFTWVVTKEGDRAIYRADGAELPDPYESGPAWRPSIFMPRWASRITLEITEVRVQRLQEITAADACDEGALEVLDTGHPLRAECYAKHGTWTGDDRLDVDGPYAGAVAAFATLWDSINGKPRPMLDDDGEPVLDDNDRPIMVASRSWASNPWVWAICFRRLP